MSDPIEPTIDGPIIDGPIVEFSTAITDSEGSVIWGIRPDGTVFVGPALAKNPTVSIYTLWQLAREAQRSNVGAAFPELAEALDDLVRKATS